MERIQDFFTKHSLSESKPVLPLGSDIFSLENNTRSVESVLAELGFHPFLLDHITTRKVRFIPNNEQGRLTTAKHFKISDVASLFTDGAQDAWSIPPSLYKFHDFCHEGYIIQTLPSAFDYREEIASLANIPSYYISALNGNSQLIQGMTLAHEITHLELPHTRQNDPERTLNIELSCDINAHRAFQNAVNSEVFDITSKEFKYARAIGALIPALTINLDYDGVGIPPSYNHATALFLDDETIYELDDPVIDVIAAHKIACDRMVNAADRTLQIPIYIRGYLAAHKIALEQKDKEDLAHKIILLYKKAAEYLSPHHTKNALEKYGSPRPTCEPEETGIEPALALELS
jgi:hypothetical protein